MYKDTLFFIYKEINFIFVTIEIKNNHQKTHTFWWKIIKNIKKAIKIIFRSYKVKFLLSNII